MSRLASILTGAHVFALVMGLFGILVAIPHPELWARDPNAAQFYAFAIARTGWVGMTLGALAMFAFGVARLGWRRTLIFFVASAGISAAAELIGTATGWPFGGYEYLSFLGWKILGRVPFGIPLSWFYMGFAAFVLADAVAVARAWPLRTLSAVLFGTWLLVSWDLALDPSMAAPQMRVIHFWVWHETGGYFGMPWHNLVGWFGTGLVFTALGRLLWFEDDPPVAPVRLPFVVYAANIVWSMTLALANGLWPAALAAALLSLAPATLALAALRPPQRYAPVRPAALR